MKRWFAARLGDYENDGTLVPKTNLYPCNSRIWSTPGRAWCIGQLAANNVGVMQADQDIVLFPDQMLLDLTFGSFAQGVRNGLSARLAAAGFDVSALGPSTSNRGVLHSLVHQLQPGIDIETGDVTDVE